MFTSTNGTTSDSTINSTKITRNSNNITNFSEKCDKLQENSRFLVKNRPA